MPRSHPAIETPADTPDVGTPATDATLVADRLLDAATRVLADEGAKAVSARRLAREIGTSTMAVYTHFGSMDDVFTRLWRRGFARFGAALHEPSLTDDPVADWLAQGWAYRRFALDNPHLYPLMFSEGLRAIHHGDPADAAAAYSTFEALLTRIQRCADAGRWAVDDVLSAGETVWATTHGFCSLEVTGYFGLTGRDPKAAFTGGCRRLALGFGDDPIQLERSLARARRRVTRTP